MTEQTNETIDQTTDGAPEVSTITFEELGLSEAMLGAVASMGFEGPTDVQAQAVPPALEGRDLLVQSRTGSGKTAAFGIPICERLVTNDTKQVQALVLAPTRELALQVHKEVERIGDPIGLQTMAIYGGAPMGPQVKALEDGAQFVAGTPGRVLDHIRRKTLDTSGIQFLVLDEADEMLSMGFLEEINAILDALPEERQTLLFSATIPGEIERLSERYLKDPVHLYLSEDFVGVREIDHVYYLVTGGDRPADLLRVIEFEDPESAIIFCNTREETSRVADYLSSKGFSAQAISSDLSQKDRERVMGKTRSGDVKFLCATDIAARGIDIADLSHVINYSFPESADVYVHRTGRTGRAGKSGIAVSMVSPKEIGSFYYLKLIHRIYPEERHLPTAEELQTRREALLYDKLTTRYADCDPSPVGLNLAKRVWGSLDGMRITALALQEMLDKAPLPQRKPEPRTKSEDRDRSARNDEQPRDRGDRGRGRREERGGGRGRDRDRGPSRGRDRNRDGGRDRPRRERDDERQGRKTRRSRGRDDEAMPKQESITTGDGDVEFFETVEMSQPRAKGSTRPKAPADDMARIYVNVGRRHNIGSEDLTSLFQVQGELSADQIGPVSQRDRHSYVDVKDDVAEAVIDRLDGAEFAERKIKVERAKPLTRG